MHQATNYRTVNSSLVTVFFFSNGFLNFAILEHIKKPLSLVSKCNLKCLKVYYVLDTFKKQSKIINIGTLSCNILNLNAFENREALKFNVEEEEESIVQLY